MLRNKFFHIHFQVITTCYKEWIKLFYSKMVLSGYRIVLLKVLSSEMDLAKSWIIRKVLIKGRGAEISGNFAPSSSLWQPFEFLAPCRTVLAIRILTSKGAQSFSCSFYFTSYKDWRNEKTRNQLPMAGWIFYIFFFHFQLEKPWWMFGAFWNCSLARAQQCLSRLCKWKITNKKS